MTVQTSIFDFKPIYRPPSRTVLRSDYEDDGFAHVYRTDARSIVASFGHPYDGKALSDTRILNNDYHGTLGDDFHFHSGEGMNEDYPFYSFLQCEVDHFKMLGDRGTVDILNLSTYNKDTHGYDRRYEIIESVWMDDDLLHYDTAKGDGFDIRIEDDSGIDPYRLAHYDPTFYTECLVNEAIKAGIPMDDLLWFYKHYAYALKCYAPFVLDIEKGGLKLNPEFDTLMSICERLGIVPQVSQDVPKPTPEGWMPYPVDQGRYCAHSRTCEDKKEGRCSYCEKWLWNRQPIAKAHQNDPSKANTPRKFKKYTGCDEECEEDCRWQRWTITSNLYRKRTGCRPPGRTSRTGWPSQGSAASRGWTSRPCI